MINLYGHQKIREEIFKQIKRDSLPHALLFSGIESIGKKLVAQEMASQLLCVNSPIAANDSFSGCGQCHQCRLFLAGNHPDYLYINFKEKTGATTNDTRSLISNISLKPYYNRARTVILDNIESIHQQAANALLKTLEEPPLKTYFVLIATNKTMILPTLVSRCQVKEFFPVTKKDLLKICNKLNIDIKGLEPILAKLPQKATVNDLLLLVNNQEKVALYDKLLLETIKGNTATAYLLSSKICDANDKEDIEEDIRLLQMLLKNKIVNNRNNHILYALLALYRAPYYIYKRHISPSALLEYILINLSSQSLDPDGIEKIIDW